MAPGCRLCRECLVLAMSPRRISFLSGSTETTPGDPEPEMGWGAGVEVSE